MKKGDNKKEVGTVLSVDVDVATVQINAEQMKNLLLWAEKNNKSLIEDNFAWVGKLDGE